MLHSNTFAQRPSLTTTSTRVLNLFCGFPYNIDSDCICVTVPLTCSQSEAWTVVGRLCALWRFQCIVVVVVQQWVLKNGKQQHDQTLISFWIDARLEFVKTPTWKGDDSCFPIKRGTKITRGIVMEKIKRSWQLNLERFLEVIWSISFLKVFDEVVNCDFAAFNIENMFSNRKPHKLSTSAPNKRCATRTSGSDKLLVFAVIALTGFVICVAFFVYVIISDITAPNDIINVNNVMNTANSPANASLPTQAPTTAPLPTAVTSRRHLHVTVLSVQPYFNDRVAMIEATWGGDLSSDQLTYFTDSLTRTVNGIKNIETVEGISLEMSGKLKLRNLFKVVFSEPHSRRVAHWKEFSSLGANLWSCPWIQLALSSFRRFLRWRHTPASVAVETGSRQKSESDDVCKDLQHNVCFSCRCCLVILLFPLKLRASSCFAVERIAWEVQESSWAEGYSEVKTRVSVNGTVFNVQGTGI